MSEHTSDICGPEYGCACGAWELAWNARRQPCDACHQRATLMQCPTCCVKLCGRCAGIHAEWSGHHRELSTGAYVEQIGARFFVRENIHRAGTGHEIRELGWFYRHVHAAMLRDRVNREHREGVS